MLNKKEPFRIIADNMIDFNMLANVMTECMEIEPNAPHFVIEVKDEEQREEYEAFIDEFLLYEDTGATYDIKVG